MIDEEQEKDPGLGTQLKNKTTQRKQILNANQLAEQDFLAIFFKKKVEHFENF